MATKNKGTQKYKYYKVEGDSLERIKKVCPKCGPGVFMAEHLNRYSCGKCGYTEWKKNK
ncbi:30S ribosomal protein S27ae [Methanothermococcus sp.]|uniref:30S ribosomal protein S27ae n=1 Tax=Methanothermococcus sp. TaxID=2614238 RepID=UPI0025DF48E5|nr:30S ribosomal protein S27ae [Methanothermococcus sp.]